MKRDVLQKILNTAPQIDVEYNSKIVFISDCHRGDGTWKDNLIANTNVYMGALKYYYRNGFTHIELGDGDELWKVPKIEDIYEIYPQVFQLLLKFKEENRYCMIYGNHDEIKKKRKFQKHIDKFEFDNEREILYKFFNDLPIYEGVILNYKPSGRRILAVHGHQFDFFNYRLRGVSQFLVRYFWSFMEQIFGFKDPTSPAKSSARREVLDIKIQRWCERNNQPLIAGHTHRPIMPKRKGSMYFNDGCCVHPYSISCIEIEKGKISLVKWRISTMESGILSVDRQILDGPINISAL
ncbi:UDP-2,3-diacylglucosamine pyrophosphatase LpxH [Clostridium collagenovorans DSM 3089]|uniref:UDP-2,3-diacylglucosamine pyrophosphatase LpxH n=1 Tax=Clostridium collagenovorans DSM 3089 TaxID=1121306 RepID=A0A1M5YJ06_9CLOT|nr:metallophosphoesterase [Clostridium collagenovorans]SHI11975.1 UDP-2,3-diacylglucosamine pyrophosphatase LpxH [Clostridium collagenovorans DSM 3089]